MMRIICGLFALVVLSGFSPSSAASSGSETPSYDGYYIVGKSYARFNKVFEEGMGSGYFYYQELTRKILPHFKGLPYGAGNVSCPYNETLINFQSFDCVTLVETFWALSYTMYEFQSNQVSPKADPFKEFAKNLDAIRYFGGENCGMDYRIHYFTQEMEELTRSGKAFNVAMANGSRFWKKINYITENEESFGELSSSKSMKQLESILSRTPRYYYPLSKRNMYYPMAEDGDIIAFAAREEGLDVSHCGIVTIVDGKPTLNHASGLHEKVVLEQDLERYIRSRTRINGFFVYRPVFD